MTRLVSGQRARHYFEIDILRQVNGVLHQVNVNFKSYTIVTYKLCYLFFRVLLLRNFVMHSQKKWIEQDPELAVTLPSKYFYNDDIFQQEKERIFLSGWQLVGHKSELSKPGQFVVTELFDQSVIAACDKKGEVHAFHNVCQHRGNRLVSERRGQNNGLFRCAYHAWCYEANGQLRGAPRSERIKGFDTEAIKCPAVKIEVFFGFYFINLDSNAPAMSSLYPGADETIRKSYPEIDNLKLIAETDVIVPANWKVIMDNSIEGYHFKLSGPCHIDLAELINFNDYKLQGNEKWWVYAAPSNLNVKEPYGVPLTEIPDPDDQFFNVGLWPNNTFYHFPFSKFFATFIMIPLGPEKSLLRFGYYSVHDPLPEVTTTSMRWMDEKLGPEDIDLNISVQKGLHSMGYEQGRYMIDEDRSNESEHLVHHFHSLVYRALHEN
ncbi:MAG: phenylpropionate dioxygenase-like ring-hydroxylating dioxygenase large terminal subunit [Gammaproteobacteria bacterium]